MSTWPRALPAVRFDLWPGSARLLVFSVLATAVAVGAGLLDHDRFGQVLLIQFTVMGVGFGRQSIGHDRLTGRAVLYFQRPVTPWVHYGARLALLLGLFAASAVLAGVASVIAQWRGGTPYQWVHAVGALYLGMLLLVMTMAISSMARRHDLEVVLLILFVTGAQVLIANWLGFAGARELLRWLLFPLDALFFNWEQWRTGVFSIAPRHAWHLAAYPLVWLAILGLRVHRQDIGAADYQVT